MTPLEDLLQQCTVKIAVPGGWGTGFFVATRLILTCAHVVRNVADGQVTIYHPAGQQPLSAIVKAKADDGKTLDLALVELSEPLLDHPCVLLGEDSVALGQALYSYGYLESYPNAAPVRPVNEGLTGDTPPLLKLQGAQIERGISGAALLDLKTGKVCGMVKETRAAGFDLGGGAIPARVILEHFPELRELQREWHGGDRRWVNLVTPHTGVDFQLYREAVIHHYSQERHLYTPTDALLPLEARLVEQNPKNDRQEQSYEKTVEQFPVLVGLRKYALGDQREHVLLAGRPGSGKSMTLRQLVVALAEEGQVPVLVQLKGDRAVPKLIQAEFRRMKQRVTLDQVDEWLLSDRLVLLLDGVNEIPTENLRRSLAQFREDNPTVSMILTTRDLSLGGDLGIGKRLEMKPLSEPQLREFVGKYLPEQGDRLLGQLRDRLWEIAETPLLLKMLCNVFQQTGEVPQSKGELFRRFDAEYERFKGVPAVSEDFRRFKSELLQQLAWVMMQGNSQQPTEFNLTLDRLQAERRIEQWLAGRVSDPATKAREWVEDLLEHHLLQVAADSRQIEFHHQLFQEYYAAEALLVKWQDPQADVTDPMQFQQGYLNYLKWTEVIAIALSLLEDRAQALQVVQQALDVDWRLGAKLAGEVKPAFQAETIELLKQHIAKKNLPEWLNVEIWGRTRSKEVTSFLLNALSNHNIYIANQAAFFIGQTTDQIAIDLLFKRLEKIDLDYFSRTSFGGPDNTGNLWTKHIEALAYLSPQKAIQFLRNKLIDSVDEKYEFIIDLLTKAPQLLMQLDGDAILPRLIKELYDAQSENQEQIIQFERKLHEQSQNPNSLLGWDLTPRKIEQIKESAIANQKSKSLNLINHAKNYDSSIPDLIRILKQEKNKSTQIEIIKLIGRSTTKLVNRTLIELLTHEKFEVRDEAGRQLIKRNIRETGEVEKLLVHENWDVAFSAAFVLGCLGKASALCILSDATRYHFTSTLSSIDLKGDELTEEQQKNLVKSFIQSKIRRMAAKALGSIEHEKTVSCLLDVLHADESEYVRREAAFSLANLGKREAISELLNALDASIDERKSAIQGLIKLDAKESLWNIVQAKSVCWQIAATGLGKLGETQILPYLCQALTDLGFESANEVIHLLAKLADLETCHWLVDALENPEKYRTDQYFCNRLALVLMECHPDIIGSFLSALEEIVTKKYIRQILWLIPAIQANCKYYNHQVFQAHLEAQKSSDCSQSQKGDPNTTTTINLEKLILMTEKPPIFNQQNATIGVNYAAEGSTIEFTQHTSSSEQTFEILLTDYQEFIQQLQQKYSILTDPVVVPQIIEVEAELLKAQDQPRWQNFLNLKRLCNGSRNAGIKVSEHFAENNVWAKGAIAFLEGVSEDTQ